MQQRYINILLVLSLAGIGVLSRLIDHQPNFAPIAALALISGYYLRQRWSLAVPMVAMAVSDVFIGGYTPAVMVSVYGCYALAWLLGRHAKGFGSLAASTLTSSVLFFFATNTAVWAFTEMYAKTAGGLGQALLMGLPFFRATLASDVLYTTAFVVVVECALAWQSRLVAKESVSL